jgi:hypothetical protein
MAQYPISHNAFDVATWVVVVVCVILFWTVGYDPRKAPRYFRNNLRWIVINTLIVIAAVHALWLAPTPPAGTPCVDIERVWGPLNMVLSCDSYEFIRIARKPGRLSRPNSYRQSRPLGAMAAALLTRAEPIGPYTLLPDEFAEDAAQSPNRLRDVGGYPYRQRIQPGWLAYIVLNFVTLLAALMLFRRLNAPRTKAAAVTIAVVSFFLMFSPVVKGFFWSAHTQMWSVLMPLIAIALSQAFLRRPTRSWLFMTATGALLGIGALAYGSLIVCVPVAILSIAVGFRLNREQPQFLPLLGKICCFLAAFAAPLVIWIQIIKMTTGSFYNAEIEDCQMFSWMLDAWRAGGAGTLISKAQPFLAEFFMHLWTVVWPALPLLAIVLLVGYKSLPRLREIIRERSQSLIAALITMVMCFGFFGLMGFYRDRLEFNVMVPIIVMAGIILSGLLERMPRRQVVVTLFLVVAVTLGYVVTALVRVGPYV